MLARARTAGGASGDERAADAVGKRGADARVLPRHRVRCVRHPVLLSRVEIGAPTIARARSGRVHGIRLDLFFSHASRVAGKRFYDLKVRTVRVRLSNAKRCARYPPFLHSDDVVCF